MILHIWSFDLKKNKTKNRQQQIIKALFITSSLSHSTIYTGCKIFYNPLFMIDDLISITQPSTINQSQRHDLSKHKSYYSWIFCFYCNCLGIFAKRAHQPNYNIMNDWIKVIISIYYREKLVETFVINN